MDVLNDVLDTLKLKGILYFRTNFSEPWAITVPAFNQVARFHLVIQGNCFVKNNDGKTIKIGPGDLALIPGGTSHILSSNAVNAAPPLETILQSVAYDGKGVLAIGNGDPSAATQLICGHFSFRKGAEHPFLQALPSSIIIRNAQRIQLPWLDELLRLMARQVFVGNIGSEATISRLSEMILIELLRASTLERSSKPSFVRALSDGSIGKALQLIHNNPSDPWTVQSLATEVGMSRSRFAARFSEYIGFSPMAYLSDWRMQKALSLLDERRSTVQQIASLTGYRSSAAFTRAFSNKFGYSPTEYRQIST